MGGCSKSKYEVKKPLVRVETAEVLEATIPLFLEGIGHVRAFNSVDIKSQVEGELIGVHYEQGQMVKEGELLVTIDPRPYQAQLHQAEGLLLETKANLRFAEEKVMRYTKLVKDDYVSKLDYDQYVTSVEALLASIKKNEGALDDAKVNLSYCYIKAPFQGRVGKRLIDKGNLIANDGATLMTLDQMQPIYVDFSLPEKQLTRILLKQAKGDLKICVRIPEVNPVEEEGELVVIDNRVDPATGMIPLRAQFLNKQGLLWPGQFAKVRLILEEKSHAKLIPEEGVNIGQKGYFALVIDENQKVSVRSIILGETIAGICEIKQGLKKGEIVITQGQINTKIGDQVEIVSVNKDYIKDLNLW
ncbi:MAG: efflux RND transporter periplasmic adaptor subunit [Chlamydiota bacterium]